MMMTKPTLNGCNCTNCRRAQQREADRLADLVRRISG